MSESSQPDDATLREHVAAVIACPQSKMEPHCTSCRAAMDRGLWPVPAAAGGTQNG